MIIRGTNNYYWIGDDNAGYLGTDGRFMHWNEWTKLYPNFSIRDAYIYHITKESAQRVLNTYLEKKKEKLVSDHSLATARF